MKCVVFDSGPIISLTMNNLLWILEPLGKTAQIDFYIPEAVKRELVDEPLETKRFMFEALQVQELISRNVLKVYDDKITKEKTLDLLRLANTSLSARGRNLVLLHYGEMAAVAATLQLKALALVIDERITREMCEHPMHLAKIMSKRLRTSVTADKKLLYSFREKVRNVYIIRSTELAAVAFEKGLLDRYVSKGIPNPEKTLLKSILWGLKLDGTAINERGINAISDSVLKNR